jgi:hypothetical protein
MQRIIALQSLIGITEIVYNQSYPAVHSFGVLSDPSTKYAGWHAVGKTAYTVLPDFIPNAVFSGTTYQNAFPADISGQGHGQFLVMETATVPLPAVLWLFGFGLLGLIEVARKS